METLDWSVLRDVGIGIIALVLLYQTFTKFVGVWQKSLDIQQQSLNAQVEQTKALDRNAEAYERLAEVFEKASIRETAFQQEVLTVIHDTNRKVTVLHDRAV